MNPVSTNIKSVNLENMRFVNQLITISILGFLISCGQGTKTPISVKIVSDSLILNFSKASGYFVRNDFSGEGLTLTTIDSKEKLEAIFGYATVMGEGGSATPVNFENQFALAAVYSTTDLDIRLEPKSLVVKNDTLKVSVELIMGQKQSYQSRPFALLIVDGKPGIFKSIKTQVNARTTDR